MHWRRKRTAILVTVGWHSRTTHYCMCYLVSFSTDEVISTSYLSPPEWNEAGLEDAAVWDWPSRLGGEGSIPPSFYVFQVKEARLEKPFISPQQWRCWPCGELWEEHSRQSRNTWSSYSDINFFIFSIAMCGCCCWSLNCVVFFFHCCQLFWRRVGFKVVSYQVEVIFFLFNFPTGFYVVDRADK